MLIASLFLVLLGIAAAYDIKTKTIPDWISGLLWIVAAFCVFYPNALALACCMFGVLVLGNTLAMRFYKAPFVEWGDVLIFPPFFAAQAACFGETGLLLAVVSIGVNCVLISGKKIPFAPLVFLTFALSWLFFWIV